MFWGINPFPDARQGGPVFLPSLITYSFQCAHVFPGKGLLCTSGPLCLLDLWPSSSIWNLPHEIPLVFCISNELSHHPGSHPHIWFSSVTLPCQCKAPNWSPSIYIVLLFCCCLVTKLCLTLLQPMDCSMPGSSVHGISQARILEGVTISFFRRSSWPRDRTHISCIGRWILYHWATREIPILSNSQY